MKRVGDAVKRRVAGRGPRILTVKASQYLTPNMIRVTFAGPELTGIPAGCEGGNCKLLIPAADEPRDAFVARVSDGPAPVRRTYTVRHFREDALELDIDFVAHGDNGPASRWASQATAGDFLGFMGPSGPKVTHFEADWYLVAADPSALPVAAATLEAMPRDAKGVAIFEVTAAEDEQTIDAPAGVEIHWLVHPDPQVHSTQQEDLIRNLPRPTGRVQTCVAGESGVIKSLRGFLRDELGVSREDQYLSGYWKIGLVEDEHQAFKRAESG
ncbi:MAG: siderophore-interacting protein [Pseudomonadota bacterium]